MQALDYYNHFQALLLRLATEFINLPPQESDQHIDEALRLIGEFVNVDRCYIAMYQGNNYEVNIIEHEWSAPQVEPISAVWTGETSTWFVEQMMRLDVVPVAAVDELPPEAAAYRDVLQFFEIKSCLDVPLVKDGRLFGFIGYETVHNYKDWPDETIALLRVVGEIYVNALQHRQAEQAHVDKEKLQIALRKERELSEMRASLMSMISHEF